MLKRYNDILQGISDNFNIWFFADSWLLIIGFITDRFVHSYWAFLPFFIVWMLIAVACSECPNQEIKE